MGRRFAPIIAALLAVAGLALAGLPASAAVSVETPRVAGADRYATSAEVSEVAFPSGSSRVVIASGSSFADGLAASALAGDLDAPVLLVPGGGPLPASITAELTRLGATSVRIIGGQAAVSVAVAAELEARGLTVSRIGGADRFDTAALVARRIGVAGIGQLDGLRTVFLATGLTFPDALAASAPAYSGVHPILLTATGSLSPAAAAAIRDLGIQQVIIMGGTAAVSSAVENSVERTGVVVTTTRIAGADRGATARELADLLVEPRPDGFGYGTTQAVITSGVAFPDALAAGPLAGRAQAPILFASPTTDAAASFLRDHRATITALTIVGGVDAVTASQVAVLDEAATLPSNQSFVVTPSSAQVLASVPYSPSTPSTYVQYVARDIPAGVSHVSIALADPAKVAIAANGTVTFTKAAGTPVRADLTNTRVGDLKIRAVDGSTPTGGAATSVANISVGSDRSVGFRVAVSAVTGIGEAVPVVFEAKSGNLPVGTDGTPTTAFAVGGEVEAIPAEQTAPSSTSVTVWSVGVDRFVGATSATAGRLFHLRTGDDYRIGGVGGTAPANRTAFLTALSQGDAVAVQYNQRLGTTPFVPNVFNITDDVVAAPTNLSAATRDADGNGSVDTVRLTFTAPRTGLQTTSAVTVRRFPVVNGVVGTTPTDLVTSWAYTSGSTGQVDLTGASFPAIGSYVYQVAVRGVTGTSFSPFSALSGTVQI
ncbi:MAG TPA: cell wall-binding repeat-containing protein, partial [Acidimicrobiales bacterium]|nr:cell wall-binding repeat-containing protein [Acidimicrobiales bacterium]